MRTGKINLPDDETFFTKAGLRISAFLAILLLLISVVLQFINIYQTNYQIVSPLIPRSMVSEIISQFIFIGMIQTIAALPCLILFFYNRYVWVIALALSVLTASQYIIVPSSWVIK